LEENSMSKLGTVAHWKHARTRVEKARDKIGGRVDPALIEELLDAAHEEALSGMCLEAAHPSEQLRIAEQEHQAALAKIEQARTVRLRVERPKDVTPRTVRVQVERPEDVTPRTVGRVRVERSA
jgi:hypothetical protein